MEARYHIRHGVLTVLLGRKGWRKADLAREMGVSRVTVSRLLNEHYLPDAPMTRRIFEVFRGVSHKDGGRLRWDDLFRAELDETGATA